MEIGRQELFSSSHFTGREASYEHEDEVESRGEERLRLWLSVLPCCLFTLVEGLNKDGTPKMR
jgi:hypothetical protein